MCGVKILHVFHLIMSIELYLLFLVRQHPYIQRYLPGTSKYDPVGAGCTLFCFFILWIKSSSYFFILHDVFINKSFQLGREILS